MIPELGKYAGTVLGAYAVSVLLLAALVLVSLWQAGRIRRALHEVEKRVKSGAVQGADDA